MGMLRDIKRGLGLGPKKRKSRKAKAHKRPHKAKSHKRLPPRRADGSFKARGT